MLSTLPNFFMYFSSSVAMLAVALTIYKIITPYDEIKLIRDGNVAAAISYLGTAFGMVAAMSSVIIHSAGWLDMIVWCGIGLTVQLVFWKAINWLMGDLQKSIATDGCVAHATVLGGGSAVIGILQAACLVY
jgi:putative membrane protein